MSERRTMAWLATSALALATHCSPGPGEGPPAERLEGSQSALRTLLRDDRLEENDSRDDAVDLQGAEHSWTADGDWDLLEVPLLLARSNDGDWFSVELSKQGLITVCVETTGRLVTSLEGHGDEGELTGGFTLTQSVAGTECHTAGVLQAGSWYLSIARGAAGVSRYGLSLYLREDPDDDGVIGAVDNCPATFNPEQTDWDGDGDGDACDTPYATPCTNASEAGDCRGRINLRSDRYIYYFRNYALGTHNPQVTRAIVVVHGSSRHPWGYFDTVVDTAERNGSGDNTLVLAPYFMNDDDTHDDATIWWDGSGWSAGYESDSSSEGPQLSSFDAMDQIVDKLVEPGKFPLLTEIVVTGFSGGGQFAQRYAAGSQAVDGPGGAPVRFVVANPNSYMYLGPERFNGTTFVAPSTSCSYDDYRYGMADRNDAPYMDVLTEAEIQDQFVVRDVIYLIGRGEDDCWCSGVDATPVCLVPSCGCDGGLSCNCQSLWQGRNRYRRANRYFEHLDAYFPGHAHEKYVVEGVSHSMSGMYGCGAGPQALLGAWATVESTSCP